MDDIREGEARLRSNLDLFLQSLVLYVKDFSPGCVCVKMSMSHGVILMVKCDVTVTHY